MTDSEYFKQNPLCHWRIRPVTIEEDMKAHNESVSLPVSYKTVLVIKCDDGILRVWPFRVDVYNNSDVDIWSFSESCWVVLPSMESAYRYLKDCPNPIKSVWYYQYKVQMTDEYQTSNYATDFSTLAYYRTKVLIRDACTDAEFSTHRKLFGQDGLRDVRVYIARKGTTLFKYPFRVWDGAEYVYVEGKWIPVKDLKTSTVDDVVPSPEKHPTISSPEYQKLTQSDYEDFRKFMSPYLIRDAMTDGECLLHKELFGSDGLKNVKVYLHKVGSVVTKYPWRVWDGEGYLYVNGAWVLEDTQIYA